MGKTVLQFIGAVLVGIIAIIGVLAACHILITLPIPDGQGPEWIGAIGTVLTLAGTIWLATGESRRRRKEARDLALVAAARIHMRLAKIRDALNTSIEYFYDDVNLHNGFAYKRQASNVAAAGTWSMDDILPLVCLEGRVAARLAAAHTQLDHCLQLLQKMEIEQGYSWMVEKKSIVDGEIIGALVLVRDALEFALHSFNELRQSAS